MGFLDELDDHEAGRLEEVLFGSLARTRDNGVWDDAADIITNALRARPGPQPPETRGFRLPGDDRQRA